MHLTISMNATNHMLELHVYATIVYIVHVNSFVHAGIISVMNIKFNIIKMLHCEL